MIKEKIFSFLKVIVFLLFTAPFIWMILISLQTLQEAMTLPPTILPEQPQWVNYVQAWTSIPIIKYLKNSILVTGSVIILQLIIMIPAAYAFARYNFFGKNFFFAFILISFMVPAQITFIPIYLNFAKLNLIETFWPQIIPFASNTFGIFLLRQAFMQLPDEIFDAALLDHSNDFKTMLKIAVPMIKPAIFTTILFTFVGRWNDYFWPLVMTNSDDLRTLPIGIQLLRESEGVNNWHIIMAGNVILVVPIIIVYIFTSKFILRSFGYSGTK